MMLRNLSLVSEISSAIPPGWTVKAYRIFVNMNSQQPPKIGPMINIETGNAFGRREGEALRKTGMTAVKMLRLKPHYRIEALIYKPKDKAP